MGQRERVASVGAGRLGRAFGRPTMAALLSLVMVLALVNIGATPANAAPPPVTVSPASGLVDGAFVDVALSGFPPDASVVIVQCGATTEHCRVLAVGNTDAAGANSTRVRVFAVVEKDGLSFDCRVVSTCTIGAYDSRSIVMATPVAFAPDGPLAPAPGFSVAPTTGVHVGDPLTLTGSGFNPDYAYAVYDCPVRNGGSFCDHEHALTTVRTDSTGSFATTVPYEQVFNSDMVFVPPKLRCPPGPACVYLAITTDFGETVFAAAFGFEPPPPATSTTTTTTPSGTAVAPPAVPVVGTAPFTG